MGGDNQTDTGGAQTGRFREDPRALGANSYTTPRTLGPARVDLTRALNLADTLEDDALAHRFDGRR